MNRLTLALLFLICNVLYMRDCDEIHAQIVPENYSFIRVSENRLQGDIEALKPMFARLHKLKTIPDEKNLIVPIVHIGDSHLQVGYLPIEVMTTLQKVFGNAGRGFISPLRLAKTAQHNNYQIESANHWIVSRATQSHPSFPVGLGALALRCNDRSIRLSVSTKSELGLDYSFNCVKLFQSPASTTLSLVSNENNLLSDHSLPFLRTYQLNSLTNQATFTGKSHSPYDLYGMSLENGKSGVLYHNFSIHTTRYANYASINSFGEQINSLSPELIVISLGTNEAFYKNYSDVIFLKEVDSLISILQRYMPQTPILLTTPMSVQKRIIRNKRTYYYDQPNISRISSAIIRYAQEHKLLYWDLYSIAGGETSPSKWVKSGLMTADRIHLSVAGSRLQGQLLVQSILKAYEKYVATLSR